MILERLVGYVNRSSFFTVLADETTDISCQEQLSLCAGFVGDDFSVEEYFLKFVPVTDLSGKELASTVLKNLSQIGIDQWRTQKIFMGGFIQWHMIVICFGVRCL